MLQYVTPETLTMEFVPHAVSCVFARREFQYFVVPLSVFGEAPERVICEGEYSFK